MDTLFVERYWIREEHARSEHSIIYRATDPEGGREIALKKLVTPSLLLAVQKEDALRNFRQEIQDRKKFSHPNVLEIHDCFEHENEIYVVEEFAEGKDITWYMQENRYTIDLMAAVHLFQKCAEGLYHAHKHNYFHRNLKPENILVTRDQQIKVSDFMVCSLLSREQQVRSILDTDRYESLTSCSAPEVIEGKPITASSNIFSLGVIMYEFFTGTHPFTGHNDEETYDRIQHFEPFQAAVLNPRIPTVLNYIIDRMLKKDPGERYRDFREFLDDLSYFYAEKREKPVLLYLHRSQKMRGRLLSARESTVKALSLARRKVAALAGTVARKIKREEPSGLFLDEPLDPALVARKKTVRQQEERQEDPDEIHSIESPPDFDASAPLFAPNRSWKQKYRKYLMPLCIVLFLALASGALYACYIYGKTHGRYLPPASVVTKGNGTSGIFIICNISGASTELRGPEAEGEPITGTLDTNGNWEAKGLAAGTYSLEVRKDGYAPSVTTVTLKESERQIVNITLRQGSPSLDIITDPPDVPICLDEKHMGLSPLKAYEVRAGNYTLTAKRPGYKTYSEKITILPDEVLIRKITLEKEAASSSPAPGGTPSPAPSSPSSPQPKQTESAKAKLKIESQPDVAMVFIDGKERGLTPLSYTCDASQKEVEISVRKKGFKDWNEKVTIEPGLQKELFADLEDNGGAPVKKVVHTPHGGPAAVKKPFNVKISAQYYSAQTWSKLRGEELVVDFQREQIDSFLQSLAAQLTRDMKDRYGSYSLDVRFTVEVLPLLSGAMLPETRVLGVYTIADGDTKTPIIDFTDREPFECDPETTTFIVERNNYNKQQLLCRSAPTAAAINMTSRNVSKLRTVLGK